MAMEISNAYSNYASSYTNTTDSKKKTTESGTTKETAETAKKSGNEEYLKSLQKQVPYMKLQIGYGINTNNDGKVNVMDVNPKLLEKMQNDPQAAKEYTQRLKDIEAATKWADNFVKSMGHTVITNHVYVDENGHMSNFAYVVKKDILNEKLRKEAQENAEKQIEISRENARKKAEQLAEQIEEKAEEAREKKDYTDVDEPDTVKDKAETLLSEKIESAKDGAVLFDNEDMQTIIDAAKSDDTGKTDTKGNMTVGANLDMKI